MTPVIYKIVSETNEKVNVLSLNPDIDIINDYRLKFLKDQYNVPINYMYKFYTPTIFYRILSNLLCYSSVRLNENNYSNMDNREKLLVLFKYFASKIFGKLLNIFSINISKFVLRIYSKKWVKGLYNLTKPSLLIFDHASHPRLFNVAELLSVANKYSIPTIDIPHGIPLYIKHPKRWDKAKRTLVNYKKNHLVLHHRWWKKELIDFGLDQRNTPILGSARYCSEWHNIIGDILPPDTTLENLGKDKLKIVFMDLPHYKTYNSKLNQDLVQKISELDFVTLIVKPQTRKNKLSFSSSKNFYAAYNENSVNLIKWADAVIVLFSSIMLEILNNNTVFLYPKYMHNHQMIHEQFNVSWILNSQQEVIDALVKLKQKTGFKPYSQNNVNNFLRAVVYNGPNGNDVLLGYKNYIIKAKKEWGL